MNRRIASIAVAIGVLLLAVGGLTFVYQSSDVQPVRNMETSLLAALASEGAPTLGDPDAKVHIVEFLDPACETCALFYPLVKNWMQEVPAEHAVKALEASRKQDKYWETLEALLASQSAWTQHHRVLPEKIAPAIADVGLDMERLEADMNSMEVLRRFEKDKNDSILLKVAKTPTYFVNGRPLPNFGAQQLADLVREELEK